MPKDRFAELVQAAVSIVRELAADKEADAADLAEIALDLLYERYPDLTPQELEAIRHFGRVDPTSSAH